MSGNYRPENDFLQRFIFEQKPIRGEFIRLQESYQMILNQHAYPKPLSKLLGEALCVAGLLSAIIKFEGRLTVQFRGDGRLKLLLAQCDNQFNIRGLAKWDGELSYQELMQSFHQGLLIIMLDSGLKSQYQGVVNWKGNSLIESIEGYFHDSEQLATKIWLSVNDQEAAGLLLQVIPQATPSNPTVEMAEELPDWQRIVNTTQQLCSDELLYADQTTLLKTLYPEDDIKLFPSVDICFRCTCSRKRGEDAIALLGKEETEAELANRESIVVTCDFCNQEYFYDRSDVAKIFTIDTKHPPTHLH